MRAILYRAAVAKKVRTMKKVVHAVKAAKIARAAKASAAKSKILTRAAVRHAAKAAIGG
jgi:hypothetical protein